MVICLFQNWIVLKLIILKNCLEIELKYFISNMNGKIEKANGDSELKL